MSINNSAVCYIYSEELIEKCDQIPAIINRASIVHDLIKAYNLLEHDNIRIIKSESATEDELKLFHSSAYIEILQKLNEVAEEDCQDFEEELDEYGLSYDCPLLTRNYDFVRTIAGGSLTGAKCLIEDKCRVAINWCGGWHHAQRDAAEGFCYVNDIVLAIQELSNRFSRIFYIDLDIHHGNGVQNAFEFSNKILTLSIHKHEIGFYPNSGNVDEIGSLQGKYYTINVPLLESVSDSTYIQVFDKIFPTVVEAFGPSAIVVQCGADGLKGDSLGNCYLTTESIGHCLKRILDCNLATLVLGGGGYNLYNTARLWTYLTSLILGVELDEDIPVESEYFTKYTPSYELAISPKQNFVRDKNTQGYIDKVEGINKLNKL